MSVQTTPSDSTVLPTAPTRDDLVLLLLPLPLLCGVIGSVLTGTPVTLGVGIGSLPAALLFLYAISAAAPAAVTERSA
ncbi:hypothetical protein [Haloplanus halobius]|uniref:hypothetical protein n=1 Tax=Haloplanus halobius TaxID=2934938 RepID=UPI00200CAC1A|nr:hypothetical protein [Haloplanus sp. XH21]